MSLAQVFIAYAAMKIIVNLRSTGRYFTRYAQDFFSFLKMIEPVGLYPPGSDLHQKRRVVIVVGKEGIKRQADVGSFLVYLGLAYGGDFLSQGVSHGFSGLGAD